ncbi:MAG: hypothetical protein WC812_02755 [Candidatus Pacearchaeota archaeon]|jgi:hypothetical protein
MGKIVFHGGVWKKKDLEKDYFIIKDALYVAPKSNGAYLGIHAPNRSGEEINTLFEIHYSNPNFFRDYRNDSTELGQEGIWIGKNLRLKKIKDILVKIPKRERASGKALRYRYIVAEVDEENSERTPTGREYKGVLKEFMEKYGKPCYPDDLSKEEKSFFYNSIQKTIKNGNNTNNLEIENNPKTLEKILKISSIIAFFGGIFFLSSTLTGNIIGNSQIGNNSIISIILFFSSFFLYILSTKQKRCNLNFPKDKHNFLSHKILKTKFFFL